VREGSRFAAVIQALFPPIGDLAPGRRLFSVVLGNGISTIAIP